MQICVVTCDKYRHLMVGFAEAWNRVWGDQDLVYVLCYEKPDKLPQNFLIRSLGKQSDYGTAWTTALIPYFESVTDSHILLMLEDYWVTKCNKRVIEGLTRPPFCFAPKIDLSGDRVKFPHFMLLNEDGQNILASEGNNVIISQQTARYRSSLQAAIWRKEYLMKFMKPHRTPWEFEIKGEAEAMNDGACILGTEQPLLEYKNIMLKGIRHDS